MTIGRKLEIGVRSMLAVTVVLGIAWLGRLGSLDIDRQSVAEKTARRLQIAAEMDSAGSLMLAAMRGMVLFAAAGDPSEAAVCKQEFDAAAARWRKSLGDLQPLLVQDDQRRLAGQMQERLTAWGFVIVELERATARGDSEAALEIASGKGYPIYRANARDTARFRQTQDGILDTQRASAAFVIRADWWTDLGAFCLAAGAGLLTLFFVRHTSRIAQSTWEPAAAAGESAAPALEAASSADSAAPAGEAGSPAESSAPAVGVGGAVEGVGEIGFRRSLLSLNTALDAARSGQPARGLPAAADEAGILVRRSAPAARDSGPAAGTTG
jgi:hypothetical protein